MISVHMLCFPVFLSLTEIFVSCKQYIVSCACFLTSYCNVTDMVKFKFLSASCFSSFFGKEVFWIDSF